MNKWNKATAAALLTAFVMTGALPAHAEEAVKTETTQTNVDPNEQSVPADMLQKEQAIAKVREMLGGLQDLPYVNAYYSNMQDYMVNGPAWSMNFSNVNMMDPQAAEEAMKNGPEHSVHVYIHAKTGELMSFREQNPARLGKGVPDKGQAVRAADAFLQKVLKPEQRAALSKGYAFGGRSGGGYVDTEGKEYMWSSSDVQYTEMVNGIPFVSNTVEVGVDPFGHVVRYRKQFRFDSSKLPKPEGIVSDLVAKIELAKQTKMSLQYQTRTYAENKDGDVVAKDNPVLVYQSNGFTQIDAFTGKPVDLGQPVYGTGEPTKHKLTGAGKVPTAKTKEEAAKVASELLGLDVSSLIYEAPQKSMFQPAEAEQQLYFMWHEDLDKRPQDGTNWNPMYVSATFDGKTGKLIQLYRSGGEAKKAAFTLEQGKQKALDLLSKYVPEGEQVLQLTSAFDSTTPFTYPSWYDESKAPSRPANESSVTYMYHFAPTYQGLGIADMSYSVEMNGQTGQLISLRLPDQYDVKLPDNKDVADAEVVEATYLQNHPLKLQYQWFEFDNQQAPTGQLVYTVDGRGDGNSYIDAFTGHEVSSR